MFLIELHAHSYPASGCATATPEEQLAYLRDLGYHGVVLTNHDCEPRVDPHNSLDSLLHDYREMKEKAPAYGIRVYFGAELRFYGSWNDYLVYGLTAEEYEALGDTHTMTPAEFYRYKPAHALFIQAHPFRPSLTRADRDFLDGIEIANGNPRHMGHNRNDVAYRWAKEYRENTGLPFVYTSGSDMHQPGDAGHGGALFSRMPENERDLAEMLRRGAPDVTLLDYDRKPIELK